MKPASARCKLCGDIIHSLTEYAEASCKCGAIGVKGGIEPLYRGLPENILQPTLEEWTEKAARSRESLFSIHKCPHCGMEYE